MTKSLALSKPLRWLPWVLAGGLAASSAQALEPDVLFAKLSPAVWTVRTFDAQQRPLHIGSGVVVAPGRLITNCHVLAKASSFVVRQGNASYGATLEFPDVERDLCQIKVADLRVAPVQIAPPGALRVGQRVYAIGSPSGLENTLSEGILSGLRAGEGAQSRLLQTTAPISPGSSGGGLFDSEGRLLGITTFGVRESGSLNFAMPADMIAEIPVRAQAALARRAESGDGVTVARGGAADPLRPGHALEYARIDRLTGGRSSVLYRLDHITGDELFFNMGGRVEKADGRVVSITSAAGGIFDSSSPPGGWGRKDLKSGMRWHVEYVSTAGEKLRHQLDAAVIGERTMRVDGAEFRVTQIAYTGWVYASYGSGASAIGSPFEATAWYAAELGRVVRFEARQRRGNSIGSDESIELVRVIR